MYRVLENKLNVLELYVGLRYITGEQIVRPKMVIRFVLYFMVGSS